MNYSNSLIYRKCIETGSFYLPTKQTSMCSFIIWNISKALERNPRLDLRHAMHSAHERLERDSREGSGMISQPPDRRYITCALLAWQQLGHDDADSLYQFVEENRSKLVYKNSKNSNLEKIETSNEAGASATPIEYITSLKKKISRDTDFSSFDTNSLMGPVVKLPVEPKIVMHVEKSHHCAHQNVKKTQKSASASAPKSQNDVINKIDAACCLDTACLQRLSELDTAVNELRSRAAKLARREAERVELIERAEAAWKDLELGYQRRLNLALEKEDDITNQIKNTVEERNNNKNACTSLVGILKEHGEIAEKEKARLTMVEKEVCERACMRLQLSEESARHDAALAEQLCRTTQLDRDLLFKEEQAQRRVWSIQNNIESARCLTHEAERAMCSELAALQDQIKQVSDQLFVEETENKNLKSELEELHQEKAHIIEDVDGCKLTCDNRIHMKIEELKQKREQLMELQERVVECKCKLPQDAAVEVRRTPSLAALCQCSPEDKVLDSCSCTSLRSQLLSSLLVDLFGGLQTEISGSGVIMPCHLLKCLEDKHNWDRSSVIKTNLLNFFAQLLVGELDIAIATSIENYHAKWVGKSCADQVQTIPDYDDMDEGWQERAIEHRAQKLPSKLAEQLYSERPEQFTNKSKDIVSKGPPPCQCKSQPASFPCVVKTPYCTTNNRKTDDKPPSYLKRTMQDVTQLRLQIENLKKDSVKKEDLSHMENKITKIVQRVAAKPHNIASASKNNKCTRDGDLQKHKLDCDRCYEINNTIKKKKPQKESINQQFHYIGRDPGKIFKKREQSFAINLCLCETDKKSNKLSQDHRQKSLKASKSKKTGDLLKNTPIVKRPIKFSTSKGYNMPPINKIYSSNPLCPSECVCLHKLPSNTSIDNLLYDLSKWKADLMNNSKGHSEGTGNQKEQKSDYNKFPLNSTTAQSNLITSEIELNNNKTKSVMSKVPMFSVIAYSSSNNNRDKSIDHNIPPTTESDCIGVIDLDKSNDNTCKCIAKTYIDSINDGDGNAVPLDDLYTWHKTDFCACVKIPEFLEINNTSNQNIHGNEKSVLQNESQIYSELQEPHLRNFGCRENKRCVHDSLIYETIKKSQIFSSGDFDVKFLGVTLRNTNELLNYANNERKLINVKSKTVLQDCFENCHKNFPMKSYSRARLKCNDNRGLCQNIKKDYFEQNMSAKAISDVKEYEESMCICCNKNNTMIEVSNDLEVNAFNLLEEHLKGKLDELQRKCEFTCIPHQEKRELFTSIIQKVKQVISESTNPLPYSCAGLCGNETRWSRAYGLLVEYLKVKIKRVQCSCDSNDDNENPVLSKVLEKVCNLIENDFQRLKEKHIYNNNNFKQTYVDQQMSPIHQAYTEMYVQVKDSEDGIKETKSIGDISCQVCFDVPADNKSCEVMYNDFKILNTVDKNVSCDMRNVNVTDCACRNPTNMSHHLAKNFFVNLCTEPVSSKYDTITLISKNVTDNLSKSPLELSTSLKESVVEFKSLDEKRPEFPYFGYTLNCSCDHALGKCYCIKSMINTNYEKNDIMLKSLTNERFPKKISYIMPIAPNVVKSEPIYINEQDGNTGLDKFKHTKQAEQDVKYCDKENSTYTYKNIVLKKSKENCGIVCDEASTIDNDSIDTNINNEDCSHCHDCSDKQFNKDDNYKTDTVYDKNLLFDSSYVPADKHMKYIEGEHSIYFDTNLETDTENCTCKMVPICHVKMLIEDIEKKIIESKCTCNAIASRICPVHSEY